MKLKAGFKKKVAHVPNDDPKIANTREAVKEEVRQAKRPGLRKRLGGARTAALL